MNMICMNSYIYLAMTNWTGDQINYRLSCMQLALEAARGYVYIYIYTPISKKCTSGQIIR